MPFLVVVVDNKGFYFVDNKQGLVIVVVIRNQADVTSGVSDDVGHM